MLFGDRMSQTSRKAARTYSIGEIGRLTETKTPTIRYYEQIGLLVPPVRTEGNQRRYDEASRERLAFVRHARALGFTLDAIRDLLSLSDRRYRVAAGTRSVRGGVPAE